MPLRHPPVPPPSSSQLLETAGMEMPVDEDLERRKARLRRALMGLKFDLFSSSESPHNVRIKWNDIRFTLSASPFFGGGVNSRGRPSINLMNRLQSSISNASCHNMSHTSARASLPRRIHRHDRLGGYARLTWMRIIWSASRVSLTRASL